VDMNLSPRWAQVLTDAGFEAVHWSKLGLAYAPDDEIMEFAKANGYVVFTKDLDFGDLLASTNAERPSVLQVRAGNLRPEAILTEIVEALRQMEPRLNEGALVTVDPMRTRVRVLPFRSK